MHFSCFLKCVHFVCQEKVEQSYSMLYVYCIHVAADGCKKCQVHLWHYCPFGTCMAAMYGCSITAYAEQDYHHDTHINPLSADFFLQKEKVSSCLSCSSSCLQITFDLIFPSSVSLLAAVLCVGKQSFFFSSFFKFNLMMNLVHFSCKFHALLRFFSSASKCLCCIECVLMLNGK